MGNFDLNSFFSNDLLKTNKGGAKESIYKKDIFEGVENKKSLRTKLRKLMFNYCSSIINITDNEKAKNLAKDFSNFYASVYKVNDFSLSSVSSANTEESKKEILTKGLEKFNTLLMPAWPLKARLAMQPRIVFLPCLLEQILSI